MNPTQKHPHELSKEELNRAAFNLPADEFMLGGRVFKIHDLPYDDYCKFCSYVYPMIESFIKKFMAQRGGDLNLPDGLRAEVPEFSGFDIFRVCEKQLPEMVCIICSQTDPTMTVTEVKRLAGRPQVLLAPVIQQIKLNHMVEEFASFFGQMMTMAKGKR